tara:strand:- start:1712 stop:2242 length:531 start_codon:yes stop_codon:yes gene_type:complete
MSALRLINETEVTSSVSSVDITDVFSADFDIYCITQNLETPTGSNAYLRFINSSGSIISASNYDTKGLLMRSYNNFLERPTTGTNQTSLWSFNVSQVDASGGGAYWVFNPYSSSSYTFFLQQAGGHSTPAGGYLMHKAIGVLKQTNTMTGFNLFSSDSTTNIANGFIRTYGLRVDS